MSRVQRADRRCRATRELPDDGQEQPERQHEGGKFNHDMKTVSNGPPRRRDRFRAPVMRKARLTVETSAQLGPSAPPIPAIAISVEGRLGAS